MALDLAWGRRRPQGINDEHDRLLGLIDPVGWRGTETQGQLLMGAGSLG